MPVVYLDYTSQYPSVFHLLRGQEIVIAASLAFEDCTAELAYSRIADHLPRTHAKIPFCFSKDLRLGQIKAIRNLE
jgi:hypothetical protein